MTTLTTVRKEQHKIEFYLITLEVNGQMSNWEIQIARSIENAYRFMGKASEASMGLTTGWVDLSPHGVTTENKAMNHMIGLCQNLQ